MLKTIVAGTLSLFSVLVVGADLEAALKAHQAQDYAAAYKEFMALATQNDSAAQANIGFYYDRGLFVRENASEAFKWYEKAATNGDVDAQYNLAIMYEEGRGTERDYEQAFKWYNAAAEQGDNHAAINIGLFFEEGLGRSQDKAQAYAWYYVAAQRGDLTAEAKREAIGESMSDVDIAGAAQHGEEILWRQRTQPVRQTREMEI